MEIQFVIVRSENAEYLCHNVNGTYVDVSDPSTEFVSGEDDFRLVEPDSSLTRKEYEFRGERFYLMPQFYGNGWLALTLQSVEDETEYIVLSVNLESMDALDLPDRTFIDVNHYPDAMEFLETNNLATYSGYKRRICGISNGGIESSFALSARPADFPRGEYRMFLNGFLKVWY